MKLRALHHLALGLIAVVACLAAPSCTPEEKHKWLATLFDGVPPLHPPEPVPVEGAVKPPEKGTEPPEHPVAKAVEWYEHKATEDKKTCSKCHDQNASFALLKPKRELCLACHKETAREHPRMHGPVALGDCLICHEAHQSPYKHLVRAEGPKLCFQCHEPTPSGGKTAGCARPSDEARCTECHNAHGGKDAFFLANRQKGKPAEGEPK